LSLKIKFYHELRHLIHPQESEATNQQYTIDNLAAHPQILKAHLRIISPEVKNGITPKPNWLYILTCIKENKIQEFAYTTSQEEIEVFASIQEELNGRMKFDRTPGVFKIVIDGVRQEGVVPFRLIDEHLRGLMPFIGQSDYILIPHFNFYMNDWFVMFKERVIYHQDGEFNEQGLSIYGGKERTYTCFVAYRDGRKSIERLRFIKGVKGERDRIELVSTGEDITDEVRLAFFGQQILREGRVVPLLNIDDEFADRDHVTQPYQHNILGITKDGKIVIAALGGDRGKGQGVMPPGAAKFIKSKGAYNAILLSNGGDVNIRFNEDLVTFSTSGRTGTGKSLVRPWSTALIVFAINNEKLALQDKLQGSPDEQVSSSIFDEEVKDNQGNTQAIIIRKGERGATPQELPMQLEVRNLSEGESIQTQGEKVHQEALLVEQGKIKVVVADREIVLSKGDLFTTFGANKSSDSRDRHIHLEGAISTRGIRQICRCLDNMMSAEESKRFWDLMVYHPFEHGKPKIQRFPDVNNPEKMKEIILDPQNLDPDCQNLRRYAEYNSSWSEMPVIESKLRVYLSRAYALGAVLFDQHFFLENYEILELVVDMAVYDVAAFALREGINELDLRVKFDRTEYEKVGNVYDVKFIRAVIKGVENAERKAKSQGKNIRINIVLPISRTLSNRIAEWGFSEAKDKAVMDYVDNCLIAPLANLSKDELRRVIGVDIVGREIGSGYYDREDAYKEIIFKNIEYLNYFISRLDTLREERGIKDRLIVYAHAGEDFGNNAVYGIWMIKTLAERLHSLKFIVHAAALGWVDPESVEFREVVRILKERDIGILASISSNLHTDAIDCFGRHFARALYAAGVEIFATTDNPRASDTSLSKETALLNKLLGYEAVALEDSMVSVVRQTPVLDLQRNLEGAIPFKEFGGQTVPEPIYSDNGALLALVLRGGIDFDKYNVITHPNFALGVGAKSPRQGEIGKSHVHTPIERPKMELLFVVRGKVRYIIYTPQGEKIDEVILEEGDRIISLGGHNVEFKGEDSKVIEVCEGPYLGPDKAKVFFEDNSSSPFLRNLSSAKSSVSEQVLKQLVLKAGLPAGEAGIGGFNFGSVRELVNQQELFDKERKELYELIGIVYPPLKYELAGDVAPGFLNPVI
ncbi:MAG: phosphodiester glycosidase family protein, partial [Candidatus Omnitrophica bacterium]|nr:phosphodiester glycosidase family protein [Candidatus Omnitrophota bacterium]